MDRRRSPERIVQVILSLNADIVALQEVDHRIGTRPRALPRALIAEATGYQVGGARDGGTNAVWAGTGRPFWCGGISRSGTRPGSTCQGWNPGRAILAEMDTTEGPLRVVGVHLGLIRRSRLLQLAASGGFWRRGHRCPRPSRATGNEWSRQAGPNP